MIALNSIGILLPINVYIFSCSTKRPEAWSVWSLTPLSTIFQLYHGGPRPVVSH